jgi:hypothetical protein
MDNVKKARLQALDRLFLSGGKFLRAVGTKPHLWAPLAEVGYGADEHERGWQLYLEMLGYRPGARREAPPPADDGGVQAAIEQLDLYHRPAFRRARAALKRLHPEQHDYVFGRLAHRKGFEASLSVATFLDRYAALRDSTDRSRRASREADRAAAATLEKRRVVDRATEQRLRALVACVRRGVPVPPTPASWPTEEQILEAADRFKAWLDD